MVRLIAVLVLAALVAAAPARAWLWPVDGLVIRPFSNGTDPYAGGQHRGIDIGAPVGTPVRAGAAGVVSFAGPVPGYGRVVTIRTPDGFAVTHAQLGSLLVDEGLVVAEGDTVGTVGTSAEPEHAEPHVHLGVRIAADDYGYIDPVSLLPRRPQVMSPAPDSAAPAPAPPVTTPIEPAPSEVSSPAPVAEASDDAKTPAGPSGAPSPGAPTGRGAKRARLVVVASAARPPAGRPARLRSALVRVAKASPPAVDRRPTATHHAASAEHLRRWARGRARAASETAVTPRRADRVRSHGSPTDDSGTEPAPVRHRPRATAVEATQSSVAELSHVSLVAPATIALLAALAGVGLVTAANASRRRDARRQARIMDAHVGDASEDPGRGGVAVRERPAPHRACGGVRGSVGHLRAVPPPVRRRRADGERHRRARHTDHGRRGQGRRVAS